MYPTCTYRCFMRLARKADRRGVLEAKLGSFDSALASFDEATFVCPYRAAARCPQHGAKHICSGLVLGAASLLAAWICVEMCGSLRDAASPFAKACPFRDGLVWQMLPLDGACPFPFVDTTWRPKGKARCWKAALVRISTTRQGAVCFIVSPKKRDNLGVTRSSPALCSRRAVR